MPISQSVPDVGQQIEMEIKSLSYSPRGVGDVDGFVVFVDDTVAGDTVLARVTQVKKNYAVADLVEVISASPHRCQPPCAHFVEGCGGCQWQHITYEYQLQSKEAIVRQALKRIGKLEDIPEIEIRGMETPLHYRNKLTLFREKGSGVFGPLRLGTHAVVPISECPVSTPMINAMSPIFAGKVFSAGSKISKINIRSSDKYGQIMLLCVYEEDVPVAAADIDRLSELPGVASIFRCVESRGKLLGKFALEYGEPVIREEVRGIEYKIGPECFFQVNISGLEEIIDLVREFAGADNNLVVDAHCGVGMFTLQVADISSAVLGIDISPPAVKLAQSNAKDNGIANALFNTNRACYLLGEQLRHAGVDLVILDPPRQGCEKADLRGLISAQPEKVIYVSCNPTTMARDLHELVNAGYELLRLAMVDMFPMTYHLEVVALCARENN